MRGGQAYANDLKAFAEAQITNRNREIVLREALVMYRIYNKEEEGHRAALRPVIAHLAGRVSPEGKGEAHGGSFAGFSPFKDSLEEFGLPTPESNRFGGVDFKKAVLHPIRSLRGDYREPVAEA